MKRIDWRRTVPGFAAACVIALYLLFFVSDMINGRGFDNAGYYLAVILLLVPLFGAVILPKESGTDIDQD